MHTVDSIKEVRLRLYEGVSRRKIAKELGISRNTVRKIEVSGETEFRYTRTKSTHHPVLDMYIDRLKELYEFDCAQPKRFRRTATAYFEQLVREGYTGSYSPVQRFICNLNVDRESFRKAYIPLSFQKGEAFQFDFSQEIVEIDGKMQTVHVAHFKLCYSRKEFVVAYISESLEMVLHAHCIAHEAFGGLCTRGIYDNLKAVVTKIGKGKQRDFNKQFLRISSHYLFKPEACTPGAGWEKGQVERQVKTIRDRYFKPLQRFKTLLELNVHLAEKAEDEARIRHHPEFSDKTIHEVFQEEKPYLRTSAPYSHACVEELRRVSTHCLVEVCGSHYSVPCGRAENTVTIRKYAEKIVFLHKGTTLAEHERSFEKGRYVIDMMHFLKILDRKPGALRNGRPFQNMPESLEKTRQALQRFPDWDRQLADILIQIEVHGLEAVCVACETALENSTVSKDVIINYINRLTEPCVPAPVQTPSRLDLKYPPVADCARYDRLMEVQHA